MDRFPNSPVFIISTPRSGSTFLFKKLRDFPEVFPPIADSRVIDLMWKYQDVLKKEGKEAFIDKALDFYLKQHKNRRVLIDPSAFKEDLIQRGDPWNDFLECTAYHEGIAMGKELADNSVIVEKSPYHLHYRRFIKENFPNARFIRLYRDPRSVVASLNTRAWSGHNTVANAHQWKKEIRKVQRFEPAISIKYEDLVQNPVREFPRIRAFLNGDEGKASIEDDLSLEEGVKEKNMEKWRTTLSRVDRELEIIERICGEEMEALGYEKEGRGVDLKYYRTYFHYWLDHVMTDVGQVLKKWKYS